MATLLGFAFVSGLVTIFAPCIWPLLPIILSAGASPGKLRPMGIVAGIITSFTIFTLAISYILKIIPFDPNILRLVAVAIIAGLGLTLVVPPLARILEGTVSRFAGRFSPKQTGSGLSGGFLTGFSLGLVWSPCAGPILATIGALAATRAVTTEVLAITLAFAIGVAIPLFVFATASQYVLTKSRALSPYTGKVQQLFGVLMIIAAILIGTNYDKTIQAKLLDRFPGYIKFLTGLENNMNVREELKRLNNQ